MFNLHIYVYEMNIKNLLLT